MKSVKNWIIVILGIIALAMWWYSCHSKPSEKPAVESTKDQREKSDKIVERGDHVNDSIARIAKKNADEATFWKQAHDELQNDYNALARVIDHQLNDPPTGNSAQDYAGSNLKEDFKKLTDIHTNQSRAANSAISSLQDAIGQKDQQIINCDSTQKKLLARLDSCYGNQDKLDKYADKVTPGLQVYAGISSTVYPVFGFGVDIGIKLKNGWIIEARALQMQNTTYYQASLKHIISFR